MYFTYQANRNKKILQIISEVVTAKILDRPAF